jgi:hypothetical protein
MPNLESNRLPVYTKFFTGSLAQKLAPVFSLLTSDLWG